MRETEVVEARIEHCRALVDALDQPAADFIRLGWNVEPLSGLLSAFRCSSLMRRTVFLDGQIIAMFGCAPGSMVGTGSPWLVTAPGMKKVKLRFIRQSREYIREMLALYPVLNAKVYRGNKPLIGWMAWSGFEFADEDEMFIRGELKSWDCRWF